ncbi:transporter suffix domain-containing protein [Caballeronia sp. LZ029]|uniref:transporter suffix domain-containing protein n=1 Tax=Caballeronia sp. LZ029 TaxID=3038564 RepID=UPI0028557418|nr:transporter suffix domain-containing protein [Caballeronia sp. LZ029]MDR5746445.1 transporter suffix domain-containing protein [Caballeronia sp. LZ029]
MKLAVPRITSSQDEALPSSTWRLRAGIGVFVLAYAVWGLVPLAALAGSPATDIAALTGGIVVGNKIILLACVAVMGKPGFEQLRARLFRRLKLSRK